jgi:hypothetical protein
VADSGLSSLIIHPLSLITSELGFFVAQKKSEGTGGGEEEGISRALVNCMDRPWHITPVNIQAFARFGVLIENLFFFQKILKKKLPRGRKYPSQPSMTSRAPVCRAHSAGYH